MTSSVEGPEMEKRRRQAGEGAGAGCVPKALSISVRAPRKNGVNCGLEIAGFCRFTHFSVTCLT